MYRSFILSIILMGVVLGQKPDDRPIAYDLNNIECESGNSLSNVEACKRWREGLAYNNIHHIFCKPIWLVNSESHQEKRLTCTPTIINYDDTMIYVKFIELGTDQLTGTQKLKVSVSYTGLSMTESGAAALIMLLLFIVIIMCLCYCDSELTDHRPIRGYNRGYESNGSNFIYGYILANMLNRGSSRRRGQSTGGWAVAFPG